MPAQTELEPAERERIYKLLHPEDLDLEPREEVLEYRVFAGKRRILLPSELDVANQRLKGDDYRNTLERHENEKTPKEIQKVIDDLDRLEEERRAEAIARVRNWEDQRISERRTIEAFIANHEKRANELDTLRKGSEKIGGEPARDIFILRPFLHSDRVRLDDKHGIVNPDTQERRIDYAARNPELLGLCLIGKKKPEHANVSISDLQPEHIIPKKVSDLRDQEATILIDRMLLDNWMPPELAPYFR